MASNDIDQHCASSAEEQEQETRVSTPKRRRLNRPVTACGTCRKLKTKCEAIASQGSCRRCRALELTCDLPGTETGSAYDAVEIPNMEIRLLNIEATLQSLDSLIRALDTTRTPAAGEKQRLPVQTSSKKSMPAASPSVAQPQNNAMRPVVLLRNLQTRLYGPKRDFGDDVLLIGSVLSTGIIKPALARYLVQVFIDRFGKWISVENVGELAMDLEQDHPLLYSTACLLASPQVSSVAKATIQQLYLQVRYLVSSTILKSPPLSHESLQALLLLSMFSPTIQTAMPLDSWIISGVGLNHAVLSFGLANQGLTTLNEDGPSLSRLRIWNALCLTNIQFSIGNARPSIVSQRFVGYCSQILDFADSRVEDAALYAEVLLYTKTEALLSQPGSHDGSIHKELDEWRSSWSHIYNSPQSIMLEFSFQFCVLLLHKATLKSSGESEVLQNAVVAAACSILRRFLDLDFPAALGMPDFFFFIVIYAALNLCKLAIHHPLIAPAQEFLIELAPNDEHIAYRFGTILDEMCRAAAAPVGAPTTVASTAQEHPRRVSRADNDCTWQMLANGDLAHWNFTSSDALWPAGMDLLSPRAGGDIAEEEQGNLSSHDP